MAESRLSTPPAVERRISAAAVLIATYTSTCTARAILADSNSALRAVTEARESLKRRQKELDYAISLLAAHHRVNL